MRAKSKPPFKYYLLAQELDMVLCRFYKDFKRFNPAYDCEEIDDLVHEWICENVDFDTNPT